MKKILSVNNYSNSTGLSLLVARAGIAALMLTHGIPKLLMLLSGAPVQFPSVFGMSPELSLGLAVFAEVVGSLFILVGFATRLAQRSSERTVLFVGVLFNVMGYTLMILTQSPAALALLMLFSTLGEVYSVPVRQAYLGDLAPVHARSSYLAVNGMTFGGSRVLASLGVVVGAYLPVWGMGVLSLTFGFIAVALYQVIVPHVHTRRMAEQKPQCASSALA